MIVDAIKTEKFSIVFSIVLGFAIVALAIIPACKGENCYIQKAPSVKEMKESTFRIGRKCYQFKPTTVDCPADGKAVEAFALL